MLQVFGNHALTMLRSETCARGQPAGCQGGVQPTRRLGKFGSACLGGRCYKAGWFLAGSRQFPFLFGLRTLRDTGARPTSGGRLRRLSPLVYGVSTPDVTRLEAMQGRPPKGARGTVAPQGAAKAPEAASDAARRAKARDFGPRGALWLERCASCKASRPRTRGRRPTSGGRQQRLYRLVYGARISDIARLETVQGRPPKGEVGRGPARQGA